MSSTSVRRYVAYGLGALGGIGGAIIGGAPAALIAGGIGTAAGVAIAPYREDRLKAFLIGSTATGLSAAGSAILGKASGGSWDTSVLGSLKTLLAPAPTTSAGLPGFLGPEYATSGGGISAGAPLDTGAGSSSASSGIQALLGAVTGALGLGGGGGEAPQSAGGFLDGLLAGLGLAANPQTVSTTGTGAPQGIPPLLIILGIIALIFAFRK